MKIRWKLLLLLFSVIVMAMGTSTPAVAEDSEYFICTVSVSNIEEFKDRRVNVYENSADSYEYNDINGGVSALDALVAYLEASNENYRPDNKEEYLTVSAKGLVQTYLGNEVHMAFRVNNGEEMTDLSSTLIDDGANIHFYIYQDGTNYTDLYPIITIYDGNDEIGDTGAGLYEGKNITVKVEYEVKKQDGSLTRLPIAGAKIGFLDEEQHTVATGISTDEAGVAQIAISKAYAVHSGFLVYGKDNRNNDIIINYRVANIGAAPDETNLNITNENAFFNVVSACVEDRRHHYTLVMSLNGSGYENLFLGNYEDAVINGDGSQDSGNGNWIHYTTNESGNYEFRIFLGEELENGTVIPLVAISKKYYNSYKNGNNQLERAFYPRQIVINCNEETLITGDLDSTRELTVTNNAEDFLLTSAELNTIGAPHSVNYSESLIINTSDFSKAYIGKMADAEAAEAEGGANSGIISETDGVIRLKLKDNSAGDTNSTDYLNKEFNVSFYNETADEWYEYKLEVVKDESKLTIEKVYYPKDYNITVTATAQKYDNFAMAPQSITVNGGLAEKYGYTDNVADGVSALDVLVAITQKVYGDDFKPETKDSYLKVNESGWVTKILGEATQSMTLYINGVEPGAAYKSVKVEANSSVMVHIFGAHPSLYPTISVATVTHVGTKFEITVEHKYYADDDEGGGDDAIVPVAYAYIGILNDNGSVTEISNAQTNVSGKALISLPSLGDYNLVAYGNDQYGNSLMMVPFKVTITEHTWDSGKVTKEATHTAPGEKTYKCTGCKATRTTPIDKLKLNKPVISSVKNAASGIEITWGKVTGATAYELYRGNSKVATVTKTSYIDTQANTSGTTYTYKVYALVKNASGNIESRSEVSASKSICKLARPVVTLTNAAKGVKVSWKKVAGASGYKVYKGSALVKTISGNKTFSYIDTAAKSNGSKYTYSVYAIAGSTKSYASKAETYYFLASPAITKLTNSAEKAITVNWSKNDKASGYEIKYVVGSTTKTVGVSKASTVTKTIKKLVKNKTYKVSVRAYKTVSKVKYYSEWSPAKSVKIKK